MRRWFKITWILITQFQGFRIKKNFRNSFHLNEIMCMTKRGQNLQEYLVKNNCFNNFILYHCQIYRIIWDLYNLYYWKRKINKLCRVQCTDWKGTHTGTWHTTASMLKQQYADGSPVSSNLKTTNQGSKHSAHLDQIEWVLKYISVWRSYFTKTELCFSSHSVLNEAYFINLTRTALN
jgi:hypothetical protein